MRIGATAILLLPLAGLGCATVVSGTTDTVRIDSIPPKATVRLEGQSYETPVTLTLPRTRSYEVTIHKEGFLEARRVVTQVGNAVSTGNLLAGGLVGIAVDQSSGAAFRLHPTALVVELVPTTSAEQVYK